MQLGIPASLSRRCLHTTYQRWSSLGIRAKMLISLSLLMALSAAGSMLVFLVNTNTTRTQLQAQQLVGDLERVQQTLVNRERALLEAAQLLANDTTLSRAAAQYIEFEQPLVVLDIDRRALPVRDRFQLDQVVVVTPQGHVQANIVSNSAYSALSFELKSLLDASPREGLRLLATEPPMLVAFSPLPTGGLVITGLALPEELSRIRHNLELASQIDLRVGDSTFGSSMLASLPHPEHTQDRRAAFTLGGQTVELLVSLDDQRIESIIVAGRNAMLVSVLLTFMVLLLLGARFAQMITRPIARLTQVADGIAQGDWQQRASFRFDDEIGRLGRAFDTAAQTVLSLLAQRDHEASQRQAILESIADGVLAIDAQERLVLVNAAAQRLVGWSQPPLSQRASEVLERGARRDEGHQVLALQLRAVLQGRQEVFEERSSFNGRDVRLSCGPVRDKWHEIVGAVAVLQDISELVATERAKNQFIATASHELRTPLSSLKGFVDLLYLQGLDNLSDDQRYALGIIRRQTELLALLVNDLLEVARLEQGSSLIERRFVEPDALLHDVLAGFEAELRQHAHTLATALDPGLPSLWIEPSHLRRILANLISNAIKYTPDGGQIAVRVLRREQSVRFEVEDNGVGIVAGDQSRIFDRFFRSENPLSVKAGGTGLGLSLARAMTELHEGQIGFHSVEGQGSCFWVEFPEAAVETLSVGEARALVL